ncbi:serine protease [Psychromarinibacter sp. C21-152]|uniref:Serine protease n=1 Tax=Psychromarinibacter sediminicola TaxID=3033385 RepID=A0AAE3T9X6_9RHOB|nr:serine protease [Psychromarinibacter sediminicola]MDF0601000.1 serine protease [Psychromarinibacter sediminicola]
MKQAVSVFLSVIFTVWAGIAAAQATFIQIEARPDLNGAQERVDTYAGNLPDVNGFRMASGWYGIALGPYTEEQAIQALQQLRAQGAIPPDSFLTQATAYTRQFYPEGGGALTADPAAGPSTPDTPSLQGETETAANEAQIPVIEAEPEPEPEPETVEDPETQQDAYRSEAQLSREERADLQVALQWFGFYNGRIDAAIGPGTRNAMAGWQESQGLESTGVLTTMQRGMLLEQYNEVLDSLGLETRRDATAGIEMTMPLAMVSFDRYEPPFAHYTSINDSGVTVLLISQTGDEAALLGLYDIMQTLEIVPLEGERSRSANSFTITGENSRIRSYTHAELTGGAVKGFTLIWPAGEDRRFEVALKAMRDSFTPISGTVLPDAYGDGALEQSVDLFSGLEIRQPERSRSGFYIDGRGGVLTTTEAVAGCGRITLDETYDARIAAQDAALGLVLLRPEEQLAPIDYARFQPSPVRLQSEVAVAGYSYEGMLSSPTMTYGTLEDVRGLNGEEAKSRLALNAAAGDAGGPVFDTSGAVMGMLLPDANPDGKRLPEGVSFATDAAAIAEFLSNNGASAAASDRTATMSGEDLAELAAKMTVLVGCWE